VIYMRKTFAMGGTKHSHAAETSRLQTHRPHRAGSGDASYLSVLRGSGRGPQPA
jgi:hypothetical protein